MKSLKAAKTYLTLVEKLRAFHPERSPILFYEFLPLGYEYTALSSVSPKWSFEALQAKLILACLITFQDDLADNPKYFNPDILQQIYSNLGITVHRVSDEKKVDFSRKIFDELHDCVKKLPGYSIFKDIFFFDLDQFFNANRYHALLTRNRGLRNSHEMALYGPFNMGMVIAGTIDLMASSKDLADSHAVVREATYLGQEAGRISNMVATSEREELEGDLTSLVLLDQNSRLPENIKAVRASYDEKHRKLLDMIFGLAKRCKRVDLRAYGQGIEKLHLLHLRLEGAL